MMPQFIIVKTYNNDMDEMNRQQRQELTSLTLEPRVINIHAIETIELTHPYKVGNEDSDFYPEPDLTKTVPRIRTRSSSCVVYDMSMDDLMKIFCYGTNKRGIA